MALQISEIKEILLSPKKSQIISKAIKHEDRLRFHVESTLDPYEIAQPLTIFLDWVKTLIPKDKYNIFVNLFQYPTPNVQLTESIFSKLERVFEGRNPSMNYQFVDSQYKDDWERYRKEFVHEPEVWRKEAWDCVRTAINSVMIIDLPKEQTTEFPEPYFYFLDIARVIDYAEHDNKMDYIVFRQPNEQIAVFDDIYYRIFDLDKNKQLIDVPVTEVAHNLGFCPAKFFWSDSLSRNNPDLKKSPISNQLGNLDWLLFFTTSKKHLDLYAPYPIYSTYEADCDYKNNETGDYCDGGFLRDENNNYKMNRLGQVEQCPICSQKRIVGVGSFLEVPVPNADEPDLRDPVNITTIDKESLDYNVNEVTRLKEEIIANSIGSGGDTDAKESINELQVAATFENKTSVLNNLKDNLEVAQTFVDDTICKLRYGEYFINSNINYGTEFYIYTIKDLYAQYDQAKKNGASKAELDAINDQILVTEYHNNPTQMQRMIILSHLEPYRNYTFNELMTLKNNFLVNDNLLNIKINFDAFIERFERENTNIINFGSKLPLDAKIKIISEKLKEYGNENKPTEQKVDLGTGTSIVKQ